MNVLNQTIQQNNEHWYISKFKTQFWSHLRSGGNVHRQIDIQALMPPSMFHKYIGNFEGQQFGRSILKFTGSVIISTKRKNKHCPYMFAAWFFHNSNSVRTKNILKKQIEEYVDIFNCQFQYSNNSNKLSFTCDVTWTNNNGHTWQKLNDTH